MTDKSKAITLVVRRGALRRFDRLKEATRELPAEVIWDRRQARAASADPVPVKNRRGMTPPTWDLADFAVVEKGPSRPARSLRIKKA